LERSESSAVIDGKGKMAHSSDEVRPHQRVNAARDLPARNSSPRPFDLMRELQSAKIKEVRDALVRTGYRRLDEQARVLGLARSTTWSILQAKHKRTGLTAALIKRMLGQPSLPPLVRSKLLEYTDEKFRGAYGHTIVQRRRFSAALEHECHWRIGPPGA